MEHANPGQQRLARVLPHVKRLEPALLGRAFTRMTIPRLAMIKTIVPLTTSAVMANAQEQKKCATALRNATKVDIVDMVEFVPTTKRLQGPLAMTATNVPKETNVMALENVSQVQKNIATHLRINAILKDNVKMDLASTHWLRKERSATTTTTVPKKMSVLLTVSALEQTNVVLRKRRVENVDYVSITVEIRLLKCWPFLDCLGHKRMFRVARKVEKHALAPTCAATPKINLNSSPRVDSVSFKNLLSKVG